VSDCPAIYRAYNASFLEFAAKERRCQLVRFIADDQVPIGYLQFSLEFIAPADLIQTNDDQIVFGERIPASRGLDSITAQNIERSWNLSQSSSCHCSHRLPGTQIRQRCTSREHQFLDEQSGHHGLPCSRIVSNRKRSGCRVSISPYTAVI